MTVKDKNKVSCYFPKAIIDEILAEARRLDVSISEMVQKIWELAKDEVKKFPGPPQIP